MRSITTLDLQYAHRFYGFKGEAQYLHGHTGVLTIEVEPDDDEGTLARMAHRVLTLRCFDGPQGRLSLSVQEMHGEILSIPQPLTILRRPAVGRPQLVSHDADDEHANLIWIRFNEALRSGNVPVREGRFGARMRIGSIADGPFQFTLQE